MKIREEELSLQEKRQKKWKGFAGWIAFENGFEGDVREVDLRRGLHVEIEKEIIDGGEFSEYREGSADFSSEVYERQAYRKGPLLKLVQIRSPENPDVI